jgi:RND family efflux transporter MFP subunit
MVSFIDLLLKRCEMVIKNKKVIVLIIFLLIVSFLLLLRRGGKSESKNLPNGSDSEVIAAVVETEKVVPRDIMEFIDSNGLAKAWQEAEISPEVSGKVKSILAEVGDELKAGDPIFKLNDELLRLQVEKARSLVTQLEGNYLSSKRDLSRKEKLYQDGVISELDLDLAKAKEKADRGLLEGAKTSLKIAQRDLRESTIRSPISGSLAERLIDIGTTVLPQMKVASVVDTSRIRIKIGISEKEIRKIKKGQQVEVYLDAFPNEKYQGTVFSVGLKANESTLTFPVEVEIVNNRDPMLKPGMVARLKIQTGNHLQVVVIPQEVTINEEGESFVFVVRDGVAHKAKITIDTTIDSQVIVEDGLSPGDFLITVGSRTISEGTRVTIKNELP